RKSSPSRGADQTPGNTLWGGEDEHIGRGIFVDRHDIAGLILAEPEGRIELLGWRRPTSLQQISADARRDSHLGHRHRETTIRDVMNGGRDLAFDQGADEIAIAFLCCEIDPRPPPLLPAPQ